MNGPDMTCKWNPHAVPANELCQIIITVPLDGRLWLQHILVYAWRRSLPSHNRPLQIKHNRIQHPKIDPRRVESIGGRTRSFSFQIPSEGLNLV